MKTKKLLVGLGLSIVGLVAIFLAVLFIANASDTELRPEAAAKLAASSPPSPDETRAARLVSELGPTEQEPKLCSTRRWCPRSEILKPELIAYLERNASSLASYNELVKLPYYHVDPKAFGRGIFNFLKLANLQRREWNLKLAKSTGTDVLKNVAIDMKNLNRFLAASLSQPQTIIEAQVFILILKSNRQFLTEAASAEPALRAAFAKPEFQPLTAGVPELDFKKVAATVHQQELRGVASLLEAELTYDGLGLSDIAA